MSTSITENEVEDESNILYEIIVASEWHESEVLVKTPDREDVITKKSLPSSQKFWWFFPSILSSGISLPQSIKSLIDNQINWHFAVGCEGKVVAILQENILEIRTSKDDYVTVVGRSSVVKDSFPQWRKLNWSPDCNLLAVGYSFGSVDVFDLTGCKLCSIPKSNDLNCVDTSEALVDVSFVEHRIKKTRWAAELILCNFKGQLTSYLISSSDGYQLNFTFSFANRFPRGVCAVCFHPNLNLVFVSGVRMENTLDHETYTSAANYEITAWRILNDQPHYKLITTLEDDGSECTSSRSLMKLFPMLLSFQKLKEDCVFKLSLSPNGKKLAAIHTSGCVSVWEVPSLRLFRLWRLTDQPAYNAMNPSLYEYHAKKRLAQATADEFRFFPIDVNWWSDNSLILARCNGSVSISSLLSLKNLLGHSTEWFEPYSTVSPAHDKGFLALECESQITSKKRSAIDNGDKDEGSDEEDDDDDDDDDQSVLSRSSAWVKSALYFLTDSERFQPPRKRPKVLTKTYRLICLKSTTPEELYNRKMDKEEYGEALELAKAYNLDADLVYQRQWKKTPVSVTSIQDYLSKIKKRSWVLHECLERVSDDIDAERELLLYGLKGTSLEALVLIGLGNDDGQFISNSSLIIEFTDGDEDYDEFYALDEPSQKMQKLLSKVNFKNLSLEQKQIIINRKKLLTYLDKLNTYEVMLGGGICAAESFDSSFFDSFRVQSSIESTVQFARNSDWNSAHIMFTHHGNEILPYYLSILSNFPETTSPYEYRSLLPEADTENEICSWEQVEMREQDWSEDVFCTNAIGVTPKIDESILEDLSDSNDWFEFSKDSNKLSHSVVTKWYLHRAREIEKRTHLVDFALELIKLGQERNIQGLDELLDDFLTLETLIYECRVDCTLDQYQKMTDMDKVLLIMSTSSDDAYIANLRQWLIPFMTRLDNRSPGSSGKLFREYLLHMSKDSLTRCLLIFQNSRMELSNAIIKPTNEVIDLALCCVYTCTSNDQLSVANAILECLPSRNYGPDTPEMLKLHDQIDEFEKHLSAGFILSRHGINENLQFIRQCQDEPEQVKELLIKLTRNASKRSSFSESDWEKLLTDVLELQRILRCISPILCYEIFVESLLCSGVVSNISFSCRYMECSATDTLSTKRVSYSRSVQLVLTAAREYFNASSSLTDPTMDLAKHCLGVISDNPPEIEEEMDLIQSLSSLNDFHVSILPLQVRLSTDRIELIRKVLESSPKSYKTPQRLLKLAYLMRVSGDNKRGREGQVLTLAAETAFENKDFLVCGQLCVQIMDGGHEIGWKICNLLGQCEKFNDLKLKCRLLSFTLIHCPTEEIEPIIRCRCSVEMKLLQQDIRNQIELNEPSSEKNLWQFLRLQNENETNTLDKNRNLDRQGCHAFYSSLIDKCHISEIDADYRRYSLPTIPNRLSFLRNLLRASILENNRVNPELLMQLSRETLGEDVALGLAYLLTVVSVKDAEEFFTTLNKSDISLQLMCYYFALQFRCWTKKDELNFVYSLTPEDVIDWGLNYEDFDSTNEDIKTTKSLLELHHHTLVDLVQGKLLNKLERGVDVVRFSLDPQYKKDTILGLVMTLETEVYETAVALASKYEISSSELHLNHLQFLFAQTEITTNNVEKRIAQLNMVDQLKNNPEEANSFFVKYIFPTIEGKDHSRLILYYRLLEECGTKEFVDSNSVPSRLRLLKKITRLAPNLDFKNLLEASDPLSILVPTLNPNNVHSLAKLANQITGSEGPLTQSSVYQAWACRLFFNSTKELVSFSDWVHQFESCHEFVRKLNAREIMKLVDEIVFSKQTLEKVPLEARKEIVKRLEKLAKLELKKVQTNEAKKEEWSRCVSHLTRAKNHLNWVSSEEVQETKKSELGARIDELDLAMSRPEEIRRVLVRCVIEGESVESLQHLISVVPPNSSPPPDDLILDGLKEQIEELRNCSDDGSFRSLRKIIEQIRIHFDSGGELVLVEDVISVIRTYFSDDTISFDLRLAILEELDKAFSLDVNDQDLILFYRTQLIVSSAFPDIQVTAQDVYDDISREAYFDFLLSASPTLSQYSAIAQLLFAWPPLPSSDNSDLSRRPWIRLLTLILAINDDKSCSGFISIFTQWPQNVPSLSLECLQFLLPLIPTENSQLYYLKFCLLSNFNEIHQEAIKRIQENQINSFDHDEELFNLILRHQLVPQIVYSNLYVPLCTYVFSSHFQLVNGVAKQLKDEGFFIEAGSLMLRKRSTPRTLQVFNSALRVLDYWKT